MSGEHWKINCTEAEFPGLWNTWFKEGVVAVGWSARWGFKLEGGVRDHGWSRVRACLGRIAKGDRIVVQLPGNRVGRIGRVESTCGIADTEWSPTVPSIPGARNRRERDGEMGRRIHVVWDRQGPEDPDVVAELPRDARPSLPVWRAPLCRLRGDAFRRINRAIASAENWVRVVPEFRHESALSDYIAVNPTRLGLGLRAFPARSAREHVFRNGKRSDVLLLDDSGFLVVVECKQGPAEVRHLRQLRGYMARARELRFSKVRGVLVHGGPPRVDAEVHAAAKKWGITTFQHSLVLTFAET